VPPNEGTSSINRIVWSVCKNKRCLDQKKRSNSRKELLYKNFLVDSVGRVVQSVCLRPFDCWDCGFESRRGRGFLSLVRVVCCQGRSLVQSSPSGCGVFEFGRGTSQRRPRPTRAVEPWEKKWHKFWTLLNMTTKLKILNANVFLNVLRFFSDRNLHVVYQTLTDISSRA